MVFLACLPTTVLRSLWPERTAANRKRTFQKTPLTTNTKTPSSTFTWMTKTREMTQRIAESDGQFSTRGLQYKPDSGRSESKTQGDQNKLRLIQTQAGPCFRNNRQTNKHNKCTFVSENRKQKTDTQNRDTGWHTHTFQRGSPYLQFGSLV